MSATMPDMPGMTAAPTLLELVIMWVAMMTAMMVPAAWPWLRAHGAAFTAGYLTVWTLFGIGAAIVQWGLQLGGALTESMVLRSGNLGALIVAAAGFYELTPLKNEYLRRCRLDDAERPETEPSVRSVMMTGARQGALCVGCCATLMALLFVTGVMNVPGIVALTVAIVVEKAASSRLHVARFAGLALLLGAGFLALRDAAVHL